MPIRPENKGRYPKDWPSISKRIRKRARNRCECKGECGLQHFRIKERGGAQIDLKPSLQAFGKQAFRCQALNGKPHPVTKAKVVLTVAHLDHQPENCADDNLKAWCQRCHNCYDAPERRRGIQERARAKRASGDLFAGVD
jgi:hypothetical protein